jgi:hypothetical protein
MKKLRLQNQFWRSALFMKRYTKTTFVGTPILGLAAAITLMALTGCGGGAGTTANNSSLSGLGAGSTPINNTSPVNNIPVVNNTPLPTNNNPFAPMGGEGLPASGFRLQTLPTETTMPEGFAPQSSRISVGSRKTDNGTEATITTPETGTVSLASYIATSGLNMGAWKMTEATSINPEGTVIVGEGIHNGKSETFVLSNPFGFLGNGDAKLTQSRSHGNPTPYVSAAVLNPANGHYYQVVRTNVMSNDYQNMSWLGSKYAAQLRTHNTSTGYLATLDTQQEVDFVIAQFANVPIDIVDEGGARSSIRGLALGGVFDPTAQIYRWENPDPNNVLNRTSLTYALWADNENLRPYGGSGDVPLATDGGVYLQINSIGKVSTDPTTNTSLTIVNGLNDYNGGAAQTFGYIVEFDN